MTTVVIKQLNDAGEIINQIPCSIIKVLKETPSKITFLGTNGFLDIDLVRAEKHSEDDGTISYYVRGNISLDFLNFVGIDNDDYS